MRHVENISYESKKMSLKTIIIYLLIIALSFFRLIELKKMLKKFERCAAVHVRFEL